MNWAALGLVVLVLVAVAALFAARNWLEGRLVALVGNVAARISARRAARRASDTEDR